MVGAHVLIGCWLTFTATEAVSPLFTLLRKPPPPSQFCSLSPLFISHHLSSHHNPLTSFISVSTCTSLFFTPVFFSPFQLQLRVSLLSFTLTSFYPPPQLFPGGLATEHHHHRQLHEQVQPSVLVPAAAQAHGVEPP